MLFYVKVKIADMLCCFYIFIFIFVSYVYDFSNSEFVSLSSWK